MKTITFGYGVAAERSHDDFGEFSGGAPRLRNLSACLLWLLCLAAPCAFAEADLGVSLSPGSETTRVGSCIPIFVSGGNNGPDNAADVVIDVMFPPEWTFQREPAGSSSAVIEQVAPGHVRCSFTDVAPNSGVFCKVLLKPDATGMGTIEGKISSSESDDNPDNDTAEETITVNEPADQFLNDFIQLVLNDPIGTFAGNYHFPEPPDLHLGGPLPVYFQRYYDSALFFDGETQSVLGTNWQHDYELTLEVVNNHATVVLQRGRILRFERNGEVWQQVNRTDIGFQLIEAEAEFLLGDPRDQKLYRFNAAGQLRRIADGRGNALTLTYTGPLLDMVTDGLGRTLTFAYNDSSQLVNVSDGTRSVSFAYVDDRLVQSTDAAGEITNYAYDTTHPTNPSLLTGRTRPESNTPFTQTYNADGRVASQTAATGGTHMLTYFLAEGLHQTAVEDPTGRRMTHGYNADGEIIRIVDETQQFIFTGVDGNGRRSFFVDRKDQFTSFVYDPITAFPTEINHPSNPPDLFTYTARMVNGVVFKDLTRHQRPDGQQEHYAYDARGNLTRRTFADGKHADFTYDDHGQLLAVTNPNGGVRTWTYDENARLATLTDSDLGNYTFAYDALHRPLTLTNPDGTTQTFTYDALDRLTRVTNERGHRTTFNYDANGRLISVVDALNQMTSFGHDALDRVTMITDRSGHARSFTYNDRLLPATVTDANGNTTAFSYDARRRLTRITDPAGRLTRLHYDEEGRLIGMTNPRGESVRAEVDPMGYLASIADSLGNTQNLERDAMKRLTKAVSPLGHERGYSYTSRGQLAGVTLPEDVSASYQYDDLGVLTQIVDPSGGLWSFTHTPMGRQTSLTDPLNRTSSYEYDNRGRLIRVTFADASTVDFTYDPVGNLTRRLFSDGTDLTYAYDALNRLVDATDGSETVTFTYDAEDRLTNTGQAGPFDSGATYDPGGRLITTSYPVGAGGADVTVTYVYDALDRLVSASDDLTGTTLTFTYDAADRLTGIQRPNNINTTYTYDAAGRLISIQDGTIIDLQLERDPDRRITEIDFAQAPLDPTALLVAEDTSFSHDGASQIDIAGYSFDDGGRQTAAPEISFNWDGASRLTSVDGVTHTYNALGDLVTRSEGDSITRYFYNAALGLRPIVAERDESTGQFQRLYIWSPGGLLLYMIDLTDDSVAFPHFDQVGSTLALTDIGGNVTDSYAFDLFGRTLARNGPSTQPFRFNGRFGVRHDSATGLLHMRARYYDPETNRFLSRDPVWPVLSMPESLNPYQFGLLNPISGVDPLGTFTLIELMVGHSVVRAIISQLLPAVRNAKAEARRTSGTPDAVGVRPLPQGGEAAVKLSGSLFDSFQTGSEFRDLSSPLVRDAAFAGLNPQGMTVRASPLGIESVWDDTDIVHVVQESNSVPAITNNIIMGSTGGLSLPVGPGPSSAVPFTRIVNNTIFGDAGIRLEGRPEHPVVQVMNNVLGGR